MNEELARPPEEWMKRILECDERVELWDVKSYPLAG